jgi:hypothetical protein
MTPLTWRRRVAVGLAAGLAIAYVDNVAFEGEVSPIVTVAMLLATTTTAAGISGRRCMGVRAPRSPHQARPRLA